MDITLHAVKPRAGCWKGNPDVEKTNKRAIARPGAGQNLGGENISTISEFYGLIGRYREFVDYVTSLCHVTGGTDTRCAMAHGSNLKLHKLIHFDMVTYENFSLRFEARHRCGPGFVHVAVCNPDSRLAQGGLGVHSRTRCLREERL